MVPVSGDLVTGTQDLISRGARHPTGTVPYAWRPIRKLTLIDVRGPGAVALGAAHAIGSHRKDITHRRAQALRTT